MSKRIAIIAAFWAVVGLLYLFPVLCEVLMVVVLVAIVTAILNALLKDAFAASAKRKE